VGFLAGFIRSIVLAIVAFIVQDEARRAWNRGRGRQENGEPPDPRHLREKRERRARICKAALLAAHAVHDLQRPEGATLSAAEARRLRAAADKLVAALREQAITVALETDMHQFETALDLLINAVKDYGSRIKSDAPAPAFAALADRFDSLLAAGRRELQRLEG